MDAFESYVRSSLDFAGHPVDGVDMAVIRAADGVYGPGIRALLATDMHDIWPEPDLDPGRAPGAQTR